MCVHAATRITLSSARCTHESGRDEREAVAHLAGVVAAAFRVALAELAVVIPPPALHATFIDDRARVVVVRADRGGGDRRTEVDSWQVIAHLPRLVAAAFRVA